MFTVGYGDGVRVIVGVSVIVGVNVRDGVAVGGATVGGTMVGGTAVALGGTVVAVAGSASPVPWVKTASSMKTTVFLTGVVTVARIQTLAVFEAAGAVTL